MSDPRVTVLLCVYDDAHPDVAMVGSQLVSMTERGRRYWWPHLWVVPRNGTR